MQTLIVLIILLSLIGFYINTTDVENYEKIKEDADTLASDIVNEQLSSDEKKEEEKTVYPVIGNKKVNTGIKANKNVITEKEKSVNGGFQYTSGMSDYHTEEWGKQGAEGENILTKREPSYLKRNRNMKMYKQTYFGKNGPVDVVESEADISDAKSLENIRRVNVALNTFRNAQENSYKNNIDIMNTDPNNLLTYSKSNILPYNFTNGKIEYTNKVDINNAEYIPLNNNINNTAFPNDITIEEKKQEINKIFLKK